VLALVRDLQESLEPYFDRNKPPDDLGEWYLERLQADVTSHGGKFLVAEVDGRIVGYATLLTNCDSSGVDDEVHYTYAFVRELMVAESARGQGIGRSLMAMCEAIASKAGQRWLHLDVLAGNRHARSFYEGTGYRDMLVTMEKRLA
jgi:ribosomal protein S18 acetylase RimI-like enzyme